MKPHYVIEAEFWLAEYPGGSANPANETVEQTVFLRAGSPRDALLEVAKCKQTQRIISINGHKISRKISNYLIKTK
jgi:hypothetical protein